MTTYSTVERIGPVEILAVTADILPTPTKYMLDCDFAVWCEWGLAAISSLDEARSFAKQHAEFHAEHGENSKEWRLAFGDE